MLVKECSRIFQDNCDNILLNFSLQQAEFTLMFSSTITNDSSIEPADPVAIETFNNGSKAVSSPSIFLSKYLFMKFLSRNLVVIVSSRLEEAMRMPYPTFFCLFFSGPFLFSYFFPNTVMKFFTMMKLYRNKLINKTNFI